MSARGSGYPDYSAVPEHKVVDIGDKKVTSISVDGQLTVHQVSLVAVLIGTRPDLSFLPAEFNGQALAVRIAQYITV